MKKSNTSKSSGKEMVMIRLQRKVNEANVIKTTPSAPHLEYGVTNCELGGGS